MSCCGNKRAGVAGPMVSNVRPPVPPGGQQAARGGRAEVVFEYVGGTAMTVVGPVTGRRYRFAGFGTRAQVDVLDAPSVAVVPNVRPLR